MAAIKTVHPASFRDPSGFVFTCAGQLYRQVNRSYQEHYDALMQSGLYEALVRDNLLIPHVEMGREHAMTEDAYRVIRPEPIAFISYPYEWCFSQLKHAALLTLQIQKRALACGMSLKDGSAYNIQFRNGKPIWIDTLSFEKHREGEPWQAYRQFCRHFLAPLAMMSYVDIRFRRLARPYLDGIPLDLASSLLPIQTRLQPGLASHIHLHAAAEKHIASRAALGGRTMSQTAFLGLVDNLESTVSALNWQPRGTAWQDYATLGNYAPAALAAKKEMVAEWLDRVSPPPSSVWDLGANTGVFSRIASDRGVLTIAMDNDEAAVEKNYLECTAKNERRLLPLLMDITNPSPGLGWAGRERMSLLERGPADVVLMLALVHHLVISNNIPFYRLAELLSQLCRYLIIEFVPLSDPQAQQLAAGREDIFHDYDAVTFQRHLSDFFDTVDSRGIPESQRTLYLMVKRNA